MKPGRDCDHTHLTAAWVLGTLTPAEAERFAAHLAACVVCQAEVASLRDATDAMADAVPAVAPPPGVSARLMAAVGREAELFRAASAQEAYAASTRRPRRRLRRVALLAVAAVSLFVGGSILGGVLDGPENLRPASRTIAGTVALAAGGPGAEAEIMVRGDDTALVLSNVDPPRKAGSTKRGLSAHRRWRWRPGRCSRSARPETPRSASPRYAAHDRHVRAI